MKLNRLYQPLQEESFLTVLKRCRADKNNVANRLDSHNSGVRAEACTELCITYYRAFETGFQQLKSISKTWWSAPYYFLKWCFVWLPFLVWCGIQLRHLSVEMTTCTQDRISAEHCDLLYLILRAHGKWSEALKYIEIGFSKVSYGPTQGMLHLSRAEMYYHQDKRDAAADDVWCALDIADNTEVDDPEMSAALYRRVADLMRLIFPHDHTSEQGFRHRADEVMRNAGYAHES